MNLGEIVLLVYALLMLGGGLLGYRAGSKPSLVAGLASAVGLLIALWVARTNLRAGLWIGQLISLLLSAVFAVRLAKTRKVMPGAVLLLVSLLALALLLWAAAGV